MRYLYTRTPHFDDIFYPKEKQILKNNISNFFNDVQIETKRNYPHFKKIYGFIVPHASYPFSGMVAAHAYSFLKYQNNENFIIIGTNHLGIGNKISILSQGYWHTPLGSIKINNETSEQIINKGTNKIYCETAPFENDHTIEIQLPFLQEICNFEFKIIPFLLLDQSYKTVKNFSRIVSDVIKNKDNNFVIGTSNFGHYENEDIAKSSVLEMIDAIKTLDTREFYKLISKTNGSLCGHGAIASVMEIVKFFGATQGILLKLGNNKKIETRNENVISYASMIFI